MIKLNGKIIDVGWFPDKTMLMHTPETPLDFLDNKIEWVYDDEYELVQLIYLVKHIHEMYPISDVNLFMPYIPNARFDRTKDRSEVFTLKYFAEVINSLNFYSVNVLDPHSHVSEALIDRLRIQSPEIYIKRAINKLHPDTSLFFPDEGSMKRYDYILKRYNNRVFAFGRKMRDWKTGNIEGLDINGDNLLKLEGRDVLIIDDICSKGGTFYHSAKSLKKLGVKNIYLYVSHCEDTIYDGELLKNNGLIEKVFTTDSILTNLESPKIELVETFRDCGKGSFNETNN